jgi:hypothetical protein
MDLSGSPDMWSLTGVGVFDASSEVGAGPYIGHDGSGSARMVKRALYSIHWTLSQLKERRSGQDFPEDLCDFRCCINDPGRFRYRSGTAGCQNAKGAVSSNPTLYTVFQISFRLSLTEE